MEYVKYEEPLNNNDTSVLNSNTIFDNNYYVNDLPTCLGLIKGEEGDDIVKNYKEYYNINECGKIFSLNEFNDNSLKFFDFEFGSEIKCSYKNEIIFAGMINNFEGWRSLIRLIGETQMGKYNFITKSFSETPIIITQHALSFNSLKSQVKQIYEILFEEFKCPYVLICSQAILNLFSYNLSSGIVVDIGESGCEVASVLNGFTHYNQTLNCSFLSGRNMTALNIMSTMKSNNIEKEFDLKTFYESKFKKEKEWIENKNYEYMNNFLSYLLRIFY